MRSNVSVDSQRAKCVYDARMFSEDQSGRSDKAGDLKSAPDSATEEDYFNKMKSWHAVSSVQAEMNV